MDLFDVSSQDVESVIKQEIRAENAPSGGSFAYSGGAPQIVFRFGAQMGTLLRASTLRFNGKLSILTAGGSLVNNENLKGTGAVNVRLDERVGLASVIDSIQISNNLGQSVEQVRNYGRMLATLNASTKSFEDFVNDGDDLAMGNETGTALLLNQKVDFSLPLKAGLFQSLQLFSPTQLGDGMTITLMLSPDSNVLQGADALNCKYELSDVSITCDQIQFRPEVASKLNRDVSGVIEYDAYSSLYSTITSSDSTQQFTLNQSQVLSVFHNFIEASHINNYAQKSLQTQPLQSAIGTEAVIKEVQFQREGALFPYNYALKVETQSTQRNPLTEVEMAYIDSVSPSYGGRAKQIDQLLTLPSKADVQDKRIYAQNIAQRVQTVSRNQNFGIGVAFDRVSEHGIDMRQKSYSMRLQSNLTGGLTSSIYTFVRARQQIQYSPQGVMVSS
jgi:hypothetical protein